MITLSRNQNRSFRDWNFVMSFIVEFLNGADTPSIVRTADFHDADLHSVLARMRIILSSPSFEPKADGFRIIGAGGKILLYERRDVADLFLDGDGPPLERR